MAGVRGALVFALIWTAACFGSSEDRDPKAAAVDASVPDGGVPKAGAKKPHPKQNSLAVSGRGQHSLHNFTMNDKEGREVVRLKKASGTTQISALQHGTFHVTNAKMSYEHEAVHIDGGPGCN